MYPSLGSVWFGLVPVTPQTPPPPTPADFSPPADFLEETIPVMHRDRRLAYVQTRWAFSNAGQSFLTWAQVGGGAGAGRGRGAGGQGGRGRGRGRSFQSPPIERGAGPCVCHLLESTSDTRVS